MDRLKAIAAKHGHLRWQEIAEELGVSTGGAGPVPQPGAAGVGLRSPRRGCGPGGGGVSRGPGPRALQPQSSVPQARSPRRREPRARPFPSLLSCRRQSSGGAALGVRDPSLVSSGLRCGSRLPRWGPRPLS